MKSEQLNQLNKADLVTYIIQSEAYLQEEINKLQEERGQWKSEAKRELEINRENEEKLKVLRKLQVEKRKTRSLK